MKWVTRFTIVAVFVLGAISGVIVGRVYERKSLVNMQRKAPETLTEQALKRIAREVKLTPDQERKLHGILDKVLPQLAALENDRRLKIIAVMEAVRLSTLVFLDASQQKKYEDLHRRMKERLAPNAASPEGPGGIFKDGVD